MSVFPPGRSEEETLQRLPWFAPRKRMCPFSELGTFLFARVQGESFRKLKVKGTGGKHKTGPFFRQ